MNFTLLNLWFFKKIIIYLSEHCINIISIIWISLKLIYICIDSDGRVIKI
jgi:hypothetical protein